MVGTDGLSRQIFGVTTDLAQRVAIGQREAVGAFDADLDFGGAQIIESERGVEQTHEGPDGAARVVVLGAAEQQGTATFPVTQVDVVAECGPDDATATVHRQHDFGLRVVPG